MIFEGNILITGGSGTLGTAFMQKAQDEEWPCKITVFSRDWTKHRLLKKRFPEVTFVVGDVLSVEALKLAMVGHDTVIHMAAMKHVVEGEKYPLSVFETNVMGSQNVLMASLEANVKHVVAISTDKACVDWHTPIHFEDGRKIPIGKVVRDKIDGNVLSVNRIGQLVWKPITNWYKNKRNNRKIYFVTYEGAETRSGNNVGLKATEDHEILVYDKDKDREVFVPIKDIEQGKHWLVTGEWMPNPLQKVALTAMVMGDGNIQSNRSKNSRYKLRLGHCEKQFGWLKLKMGALHDIGWGKITRNKNQGGHGFNHVSSKTLSYLYDERENHYENDGTRIMPKHIIRDIFDNSNFLEIFLTILYLDDGTMSDNLARISFGSYSKEDVDWFSEQLRIKGYDCSSYEAKVDGKIYNEVRFSKKGSDRLYIDICYFVPECMEYKIPEELRGNFQKSWWDLGEGMRYYGEPFIIEIEHPHRDVYCLDIEDTHNFVVNNIVVHNCHPTNTYGASKMMMERMFQYYGEVYNSPDDTQFHLCRYGNVFGSTGSFIHNWIESIVTSGKVFSTDPNMTRFWLTTDDALELIYYSMKEPSGCILIPRARSARVGDIEDWLIPEGIEVEHMGQRPGEKTHETLITVEEGYRCVHVTVDEEEFPRFWRVYPPTLRENIGKSPLCSDAAYIKLDKEEFLAISGFEEIDIDADDHS